MLATLVVGYTRLTLQTERKSGPLKPAAKLSLHRSSWRSRFDWLVRREPLLCLTRDGSLVWKFKTNGPVHSTPGVSDGIAFIAGCDEVFRAISISDGKEMFNVSSGAYTGASPALSGDAAFYGTFNNEVLMVEPDRHSVSTGAMNIRSANFRLLFCRCYNRSTCRWWVATKWSTE